MGLTTSENTRVLETAAAPQTATITRAATPPNTPYSLPDNPLVVIEPSKSWVALKLGDLWTYRELLYFLTWRDVKVRYKQTLLGVLWVIIQPLFTMLIFTLFFGRLAGIKSDNLPYSLFAFSGLLPWTFFANAISNSSNSLVGDSRLITKIYFPRIIIPMAAVMAGLVDFAIGSLLLAGFLIYYGVALTWGVLMLPVFLLLLTLLALGVGMQMAAWNIKYRDVRYALPFLIQLWMFASPIIYPSSMVPQKWKWLLALNPLVGIIGGFRVSIFGHQPFDWPALLIAAVITLVLLVYSLHSFQRMEKSFADII
jgi:lipopolysaccharide transport system permease protein